MDKLERVARAIVETIKIDCGFDILNPEETAQAAIAALEPVSVQDAARVLLGDDFKSPMLEALDPFNNDADVWQDVKAALRALAERGE